MTTQNRFVLEVTDSHIWNRYEFIDFLVQNQNGNIVIEVQEGLCLQTSDVYKILDKFKFNSVFIYTHNILETHPTYKIIIHDYAFQYFDTPSDTNYDQFHNWNGSKIFGIFYNRPTWSRIGLASYAYTHHRDSTLLNFRFDPHNQDQRSAFELEKLFSVDPESIENFAHCYKKFPLQIESQDTCTVGDTTINHTNQIAKFYSNFLIDIVGETFVTGSAFYPTEKTIRPILLKKPFVLFGPKCYLIHLRQMGFRTFHEFWDEDYDGYGPEHRYFKILKLIKELASKTSVQLQDMYTDMQPILEHNYQLLRTQSYSKKITRVD
jgi:hypothetical protein